MQYKVVKIWYVDADTKTDAEIVTQKMHPDFVSVNDKFKVGKDRL